MVDDVISKATSGNEFSDVGTKSGPGQIFNAPAKPLRPDPGLKHPDGWIWDGKKYVPPPYPEPPKGDPRHKNPPFVWDPKSGGYTVQPGGDKGGGGGTPPPSVPEPTGPDADRMKGLGFVWDPRGGWTVPPSDTYGPEIGPDGQPTGNVTVTDPKGGTRVIKPGEDGYEDAKKKLKSDEDQKKADEAAARRKAEEDAAREREAERRRQRKALKDAFDAAPPGPAADAAAQALRDFDKGKK